MHLRNPTTKKLCRSGQLWFCRRPLGKNAARYVGISKKPLAMMRTYGTGPAYVKRGRILLSDRSGLVASGGQGCNHCSAPRSMQLLRNTAMEMTDCPRFERCSAPICPLDSDWQERTQLKGEPTCFYLLEYVKGGAEADFRGSQHERSTWR
jgi:hypothetical protein